MVNSSILSCSIDIEHIMFTKKASMSTKGFLKQYKLGQSWKKKKINFSGKLVKQKTFQHGLCQFSFSHLMQIQIPNCFLP